MMTTYHVEGTIQRGIGPRQAQFAPDGTLKLHNEATSWRDELYALVGQKLESPSADIETDVDEASIVFEDTATLVDYITMSIQINHDWLIGSDIHPHLHWWQTDGAVPNWLIQYRWQINGEVKTTDWTNSPWTEHVSAYSAGTLNQITKFAAISPPVGAGLSDILQVRIIRDTDDDSTEFGDVDPLAGSVSAISFDIHIETDSFGSDGEYSKEGAP